jgi:mRNA-degrading endonuclease RelE of RelBE toxin-antitoxin system
MSYEVRVEKPAQEFLEALTDRKLRQRLERAILLLENDPRPAQAVKLKGASDYWRFRVGDTHHLRH